MELSRTLARPGAVTASTRPWAGRGRARAAVHKVAMWLRRAAADALHGWALAAGVPPYLYH